MDIYTIAWLIWIVVFFAIEIPALLNKRKGDTLTEHIRVWFAVGKKTKWSKLRRLTLLVALVWLSVHLLFKGFV